MMFGFYFIRPNVQRRLNSRKLLCRQTMKGSQLVRENLLWDNELNWKKGGVT